MPRYLVESFVARATVVDFSRLVARAGVAAEQLACDGEPVRLVQSIFLPEDETCFLLYECGSAELAEAASGRADLRCVRVVEAVFLEREPSLRPRRYTNQ
jgi:hypothetical protein